MSTGVVVYRGPSALDEVTPFVNACPGGMNPAIIVQGSRSRIINFKRKSHA